MFKFQIVCLANSQKHGGRCIAGLRTDGQGWIRPISSEPDGTLFFENYYLNNGQTPELLDVLEINCTRHYPSIHQPENWIISQERWNLRQRLTEECLTRKKHLVLKFLNKSLLQYPVLFSNLDNKIAYTSFLAKPTPYSLALIKPQQLVFIIKTYPDQRKIKASFYFQQYRYCLSVTDPLVKNKLNQLPDGSYTVNDLQWFLKSNNIFLTISLSQPFHGYCYKLVATVLSL